MKYPKTRVIVVNAEIARLFDLRGPRLPLVPLEEHVWHAPADISTFDDQQGVGHSSVGPSQHRMARHTGPDKHADAFAVMIADNLLAALASDGFERLIVIAAPRMMGLLRGHVTSQLADKIWIEIDKDLTHLSLEKIDSMVKAHMAA